MPLPYSSVLSKLPDKLKLSTSKRAKGGPQSSLLSWNYLLGSAPLPDRTADPSRSNEAQPPHQKRKYHIRQHMGQD